MDRKILKKHELSHVSGGAGDVDLTKTAPENLTKKPKGPRCRRCGSLNITRTQHKPTVIRESCRDCGHLYDHNGVL